MRRNTYMILALILVFALIFTGCAARRPLQTPIQPRQNTTGMYNNNRGGVGVYTDRGPMTPNGYNYSYGNNTGINGGYGVNYGFGNDYRNLGGNNSPNWNMGTPATQADLIARSCERVQGVDNATVVVSGNTAYVGIDTERGNTGRNVGYGTANDMAGIKRQCSQQVKAANPNITTVYVSADADFLERIRRVGDGIRNGRPVDGFRNELTELVRRLTPERQ